MSINLLGKNENTERKLDPKELEKFIWDIWDRPESLFEISRDLLQMERSSRYWVFEIMRVDHTKEIALLKQVSYLYKCYHKSNLFISIISPVDLNPRYLKIFSF